ncbi:tRNA pseudouridine(55) synthase TruB [Buchnera aphidicola]|uniref:tRNA pseudouridine(55) synthase TruB n=1 Tax=Buchnera aphidicola TaxID=9 RepID=UPI0031B85726
MFFLKKHDINGVLLLDKPKGFSSNYILQKIKKNFFIKKAGYIGTLDPLATGVLPICFGFSTKFIKYFNILDKKYFVLSKLGEKTNTSDAYGYVIKKKKKYIFYSKLLNVLKNFHGLQKQLPSMYSAIKFCGIPLYKYAREEIFIPLKKRKINIYNINLIFFKKDILCFKVHCSKGTYIRTLVENLGDKLGCGAHILNLRRLQISSYYESNLISYNIIKKIFKKKNNIEFLKKNIISTDTLVSSFPKIYISKKQLSILKSGNKIFFISFYVGFYSIYLSFKNIFLGVGKIKKDGFLYPDCII